MLQQVRIYFKWCPAPEPPPYASLRHFTKPIIVFITTAILIVSILATSMFALSGTVAVSAPMTDQLQKSITANSTPTPTPTATVKPTTNPAPVNSQATNENPSIVPAATAQPRFNVSGFVSDTNGKGIAGAQVVFCVPDIIPAVFTDSSGYYQVSAPTGTYHVYVWPPFNSSYMSFEQQTLVFNSSTIKNATLNTGYKLSGYVTDQGKPVNGAIVALNDYFNGYYSTVDGFYYVIAPAGNYTLTAHPKSGVSFNAYTEPNVTVSGNTAKNITIANQTRFKVSGFVKDASGYGVSGAEVIFGVPTLIPSVFTNSSGYFEVYAPPGSYYFAIWPPFDSNYLSYEQNGFTVGGVINRNFTLTQGYKVSGYITNSTGNPISGALVALGNHVSGWYSKTTGYYFVTVPAGNYTLTAQPRTGPTFAMYTLNNFAVNGNTIQNITVVTTPLVVG